MNRVTSYACFVCLSLLTVSGCHVTGTVGNQSLTQASVSKIVKGVTTRADVEALFGPPDHVTMLADGRRMLMYFGSQTNIGYTGTFLQAIPFVGLAPVSNTRETRRQTLQIMLSSHDVVMDYEFENTGTETVDTMSAFGGHSETKSISPDDNTTRESDP